MEEQQADPANMKEQRMKLKNKKKAPEEVRENTCEEGRALAAAHRHGQRHRQRDCRQRGTKAAAYTR
jgi:hypothetical protein